MWNVHVRMAYFDVGSRYRSWQYTHTFNTRYFGLVQFRDRIMRYPLSGSNHAISTFGIHPPIRYSVSSSIIGLIDSDSDLSHLGFPSFLQLPGGRRVGGLRLHMLHSKITITYYLFTQFGLLSSCMMSGLTPSVRTYISWFSTRIWSDVCRLLVAHENGCDKTS
jgi:hypothetical protein